MKIIKVRCTVKQEFVQTNQENVKRFIQDLQQINHPGVRYTSYLEADGKTFMHMAFFDGDSSQRVLLELPSFLSFQKERNGSGLEVPPAIEEINLLASSCPIFN